MNILKNKSGDLRLILQLLIFGLLVSVVFGLFMGILWGINKLAYPPEPPAPITAPAPLPRSFIYTDPSALTGFMTSARYDARFEGYEFPIAGSDDYEIVFMIDVFKYPSLDPVSFRVDSYDEAVEFLGKLAGECGL